MEREAILQKANRSTLRLGNESDISFFALSETKSTPQRQERMDAKQNDVVKRIS